MKDHSPGEDCWPSTGVLVMCALVLAAGYGVAVWRGPALAQEVRVVTMPAPAPTPAAEAE